MSPKRGGGWMVGEEEEEEGHADEGEWGSREGGKRALEAGSRIAL